MTGCKIGRIKMKNGGAEIHLLRNNIEPCIIHMESGTVRIENADGNPVTLSEAIFFLEQAKMVLLLEDGNE